VSGVDDDAKIDGVAIFQNESASSPLVGFGGLNDNTIKVLVSLLNVEQEVEYISYA
jgi:hypothetical protein